MSHKAKAGDWYLNKYGVYEYYQTSTVSRKKLVLRDPQTRTYKAIDRGEHIVSDRTTHLRITVDKVEASGNWVIQAGLRHIDIGPEFSGQKFDELVAVHSGVTVTTSLEGMQRRNAAEVLIQELIIEEG